MLLLKCCGIKAVCTLVWLCMWVCACVALSHLVSAAGWCSVLKTQSSQLFWYVRSAVHLQCTYRVMEGKLLCWSKHAKCMYLYMANPAYLKPYMYMYI